MMVSVLNRYPLGIIVFMTTGIYCSYWLCYIVYQVFCADLLFHDISFGIIKLVFSVFSRERDQDKIIILIMIFRHYHPVPSHPHHHAVVMYIFALPGRLNIIMINKLGLKELNQLLNINKGKKDVCECSRQIFQLVTVN